MVLLTLIAIVCILWTAVFTHLVVLLWQRSWELVG
jgi:hypothetical protein